MKPKPIHLICAAALLLAACTSAGDATQTTVAASTTQTEAALTTTQAPTTTAVPTTTAAPTTTTAPTTTAQPTIAPPTAPATTVPAGSPAEVAVAEVTVRLDEFWASINRCFEAPNNCDANAIITEYADPTTQIATWFAAWDQEFRDRGQRWTKTDAISRPLVDAEAAPDGQSVLTTQCVVNRAIMVEDTATGSSVMDDGIGYSNTSMFWTKEEGRWIVSGSELIKLDQEGDDTCTFN